MAACVTCVLATLPAGASATAPEEAIAFANQQRAAYGIPPLTLDQSLLKPECNLADHEIASPWTKWGATTSPWDSAPWHEEILYDPEALDASYGEYDGFGEEKGTWSCMWFSHQEATAPIGRPNLTERPLTFYWAAEPTGPNAVPDSITAYEAPYSPAEQAHLSNPTGPNLIVYGVTPYPYAAIPTGATVTTSAGEALPIHLLQGSPDSAVVLVDKPVQPYRTFAVQVQWESTWEGMDPSTLTQQFSFTSGPPEPADEELELPPEAQSLKLGLRIHGASLHIAAPPLLYGRQVKLTVHRRWVPCGLVLADRRCGWVQKGRPITYRRKMHKGLSLALRRPGPWEKVTVSAATPAFEREGLEYLAARASVTVIGPKPKHAAR